MSKIRKQSALALCFFVFWRKKRLFLRLECVLIEAAGGAGEVFGKFFPLGAGGDAKLGVTFGGIVFITAGAKVFYAMGFF